MSRRMKKLCYCLKSEKIRGVVFGDVYLDEHSRCLNVIDEKTCKDCGYNKK